jgi:hypothetical protein
MTLTNNLDQELIYRFSTTTSPNGIMISHVPFSIAEAASLFKDRRVHPSTKRNVRFRLSEEGGSGYFKKPRVTFYELDFPAPAPQSVDIPPEKTESFTGTLQKIQTPGMTADAYGVIIPMKTPGGTPQWMVHMYGWAADADGVSSYSEMAVEMDGRFFFPERTVRQDIVDYFKKDGLKNSGFLLKTPGFVPSTGYYKIYIRHRDGQTYRAYQGEFKKISALKEL